MKLKSLFLFALAALLTLAAPRSARARDVSFDFFFNSLSPHGEWLEVGDYGYCWRPSGVDEDWAPYSDGYWAYTDAGWTWVSYEDFGGIVYHYGRWARVEDEGWVWVPDYEWGPAWVSWRRNDDYVGWAPLPAEVRFRRDRGISVWVDNSYDIGPASYNFCRMNDFGAPVLRPLIVQRTENVVIIGNTVNITNISYNEDAGCAFNGGLEYAFVNRFAHRPIPALKLVRNTNITVVNNTIVNNNVNITNINSVQRGNQLTVIAPTVIRPQPAQITAIVQPRLARVIPQAKVKVNKGWNAVPVDQRETMKTKIAQETQGRTPENAPARAVVPADLKVVPIKADPKVKLPATQPVPAVVRTPNVEPQVAPNARIPDPSGRAASTMPGGVNPATPGVTAVKPSKKPGKGVKPTPSTPLPQVTVNPPANIPVVPKTPDMPVANERPQERPQEIRPGLIKPFNPTDTVQRPPASVEPTQTMPNTAADKRAATAAKKAAAQQEQAEVLRQRQELARQRMNDQPPVKTAPPVKVAPPVVRPQPRPVDNSDAIRANNAAKDAAAARQREASQQRDQQEMTVRRQAAQQQQQQQVQQQQQLRQNQEAAQARAGQAAAARERSMQAQQAQAATRREAAERAPVQRQQMPPQQPRQPAQQPRQPAQQPRQPAQQARQPAQQPRNVAPPKAPQQVQQPRNIPQQAAPQAKQPARGGKRPLTPEEAAQLQQNR